MNDNSSRVIDVDINEILPNRFQPRIQFDEEEILELSDSIKEHGVIQPIVVRTIGDKYEIIAGERRYKASVLAGKETVPVIIKNLNDRDSAEIALIENVQRKNLSAIEEALSYKKILDMGYTQEALASKLGKSQSSVANKIRLLNLSDDIQEALLENKISERHARSLLKLKTSKDQNDMLEKIINERLTVRRTDEEIDNLIKKEEKGVIEMNNNLDNNMFNPFAGATQQPVQTNTFGFNESQVSPAPAPEVQPSPMGTFGFNESQVSPAPVPEVQPSPMGTFGFNESPVSPASAPEVQPSPMGTFGFNESPANPAPAPEVQPSPVGTFGFDASPVSPTPEVQSISTDTYTFDENGVIIGEPQSKEIAPNLNPIIKSNDSVNNQQPESIKMPEPIIIADYNKQYDPVLPPNPQEIKPVVDFKEVINAIRECSSKIEQYGFKIDVEEYDLFNSYKVIFNIEK